MGDVRRRIQILERRPLVPGSSGLVHGGQEPRPVQGFVACGHVPFGHGDEPGEILTLASQSVDDPGTECRMTQAHGTTEEQIDGGSVNEGIVIAGADDRQVIGASAKVLEEIRDFDARLPVSREPSGRGHQLRFMGLDELETQVLGPEAGRQELAVETGQCRLGIERVDMGGSSLHEHEDDVPGFAREVGCSGCERVGEACPLPGSSECGFLLMQATQGHGAKAETGSGQEFPPGMDLFVQVTGMEIHHEP